MTAATPTNDSLKVEQDIDFTLIELLFFAYRDFTSDPDQLLAKYGFGRAHHRVLHFVSRRPGLTVAELLDVLRITKQSLGRVLKQLVDSGLVQQLPGPQDRRQRQLFATESGRALTLELAAPQSRRINRAMAEAQPADRQAIARFLAAMVNEEARGQLDAKARNGGFVDISAKDSQTASG